MIKAKQKLTGNLNAKKSLSSKLGNAIIYIDPLTQEKSVEPSKSKQIIIPDDGFNGLSKVVVNKIADNYIIPSGEIEIKENGNYDVTSKSSITVNVPEKKLGTKTITSNGTYQAINDELDGYSQVAVETSGVDINEYFTSTFERGGYLVGSVPNSYTNGLNASIKKFPGDILPPSTYSMFLTGCKNLTDVNALAAMDSSSITDCTRMFHYCLALSQIPLFDTSKVTQMVFMFSGCSQLTAIPQLNTSNVTNTQYMFQNCSKLETIPLLDFSKNHNVQSLLYSCSNLVNLGGFQNLGQSYLTTVNANNSYYKLDLSSSTKLTEQSIINVLNNLYDIATAGCKAQQVVLGSTNLAKLTSTSGQTALSNAQTKGWTVS
jgi:surface protein